LDNDYLGRFQISQLSYNSFRIAIVITQAVTLVTQYSFLMWALGIVAGIGFILVAANFEVRRDRILALFRNVAIELETWE